MAGDDARTRLSQSTIDMRFDTDIQVKLRDAYAARHEPEAIRVLARIYWAFLITGFTLTVAAAVGYGVWEFFRMPQADAGLSGVRAQAAFSKAQLLELLEKFDERAAAFEERLTAPVQARDPS